MTKKKVKPPEVKKVESPKKEAAPVKETVVRDQPGYTEEMY